MRRILVRPSAQRDLDGIWTYIAEHDPDAAARLLVRFLKSIARLIEHAHSAPRFLSDRTNCRAVSAHGHLLIYRVHADRIEVLRVIDARRDVSAIFAAGRQ